MSNIIFATDSGFLASTFVDNVDSTYNVSVIKPDDLYLSVDPSALKSVSAVILAGNITVGEKSIEKIQSAGVNKILDSTVVVDKTRLSTLDIDCSKSDNYKKYPLAETQLIYTLLKQLKPFGVKEVFANFMFSASHYGDAGVEELTNQTVAIFNQEDLVAHLFKERLAFNIIPLLNRPHSAGYITGIKEEINELIRQKQVSKFKFNMQVVLTPTLSSTGAVLYLKTSKDIELSSVNEQFNLDPETFVLYDGSNSVPVNSDVNDGKIHIASISVIDNRTLSMYVVADNIWTLSVKNMIKCLENMF